MKEKMTTVLLPRGRKQEENFVIVSVNGRSWKIMRGVEKYKKRTCNHFKTETVHLVKKTGHAFIANA